MNLSQGRNTKIFLLISGANKKRQNLFLKLFDLYLSYLEFKKNLEKNNTYWLQWGNTIVIFSAYPYTTTEVIATTEEDDTTTESGPVTTTTATTCLSPG